MAERTFPLRDIPTCLLCNKPCTRFITQATNVHGRGGRPAYKCFDHGQRGFSTFDDNIGIMAGNPRCRCGLTSRTERNNATGVEFYRCSVGACKWSMDVDVTVPPVTERVNFDTGNENGRYEEGKRGCCSCMVM